MRRLYVPDRRGGDRYLRVTWHADTSTVVVSHWDGEVCLASTPLLLGDASQMIGLLVGALQEVATAPEQEAVGRKMEAGWASSRVLGRIEARWRPKVAEIVQLAQRKRVEVRDQLARRG